MLNNYNTILLYDVETTGIDYNESKIIEFGYVVLQNQVKVEEGSIIINWTLVDNTFEIPEFIQKLTNISTELMLNEGIHPHMAFAKINELMKNADLLICHNQCFDHSMVKTFINSYDEFKLPKNPDFLDTLLIVGDNKPWSQTSKHRLEDACAYWNVTIVNAHRAIADINATWDLLQAVLNDGINVNAYINKWGFYSKYTSAENVKVLAPSKVTMTPISFGKKWVK